MKKTITVTLLMVGLLFSFPVLASGGGTGPGAKQFLEESETEGSAVSGQYIKLNKEDKVVFNLKYNKKKERFIAEEEYLAEELPEVLDALLRSQKKNSSFQLIK